MGAGGLRRVGQGRVLSLSIFRVAVFPSIPSPTLPSLPPFHSFRPSFPPSSHAPFLPFRPYVPLLPPFPPSLRGTIWVPLTQDRWCTGQ